MEKAVRSKASRVEGGPSDGHTTESYFKLDLRENDPWLQQRLVAARLAGALDEARHLLTEEQIAGFKESVAAGVFDKVPPKNPATTGTRR